MLGICRYHRNGNGWNDIGYQALVDRFGTALPGPGRRDQEADRRRPGAGLQRETTAIAAIGTHTKLAISPETQKAIVDYLAWKLSIHGISAAGNTTLVSAGGELSRYRKGRHVRLKKVIGHGDDRAHGVSRGRARAPDPRDPAHGRGADRAVRRSRAAARTRHRPTAARGGIGGGGGGGGRAPGRGRPGRTLRRANPRPSRSYSPGSQTTSCVWKASSVLAKPRLNASSPSPGATPPPRLSGSPSSSARSSIADDHVLERRSSRAGVRGAAEEVVQDRVAASRRSRRRPPHRRGGRRRASCARRRAQRRGSRGRRSSARRRRRGASSARRRRRTRRVRRAADSGPASSSTLQPRATVGADLLGEPRAQPAGQARVVDEDPRALRRAGEPRLAGEALAGEDADQAGLRPSRPPPPPAPAPRRPRWRPG